jgi:hypothetical protein
MAKEVTIIPEGGGVRVTSTGGDLRYSANYPLGSLFCFVAEGGQYLSLINLCSGETVESFTVSECTTPSESDINDLRHAVALLIGNPSGALDGSTPGSVLDRLDSMENQFGQMLSSIQGSVQPLLSGGTKFVAGDPPPAGSWTSDALAATGMRSCSFVGRITLSGLTTGVFQWQGSNDGADFWVDAGSVSSMVGHGDGVIGWSYTGATSYLFMRLVFTSSGSTQLVEGVIAIVK